jgi:non-heme chloroperoxidase
MVLAGFSMGTGEVVRYLGTYGSAGVSKAVLLGVIPPFLLQSDDNPKGVPQDVFDGIKQTVLADRYAWFDSFLVNFYNTDVLAPEASGKQHCGRASRWPQAHRPMRPTYGWTHG